MVDASALVHETPVRTRLGQGARRAAAVVAVALAFLTPAVWNGFPLIFFDTGGYLFAALTGQAAQGRSALYGTSLVLGMPLAFWPVVLAQALLLSWLLFLTLRAHGLGAPPLVLYTGLALAAFTSLPWYASQLMPDALVPASVLALYLLSFHAQRLKLLTQIVLAGIIAFAAATHMGTLALVAGLVCCIALWRVSTGRRWLMRPGIGRPLVAAIAGLALALGSNAVLIGKLGFTPGGTHFLFGRLVQSGIAEQYLADRCPDTTLRLCAYSGQLPDDGDDWLWADDASPLYALGGWEGYTEEASRILWDSLFDYPLEHLAAAVSGTLAQLVKLKTGDGVSPWAWNARWAVERAAPQFEGSFRAARQQQGPVTFTWINALHVPVALLATVALPLIVLLRRRLALPRRTAAFAAFVTLALLGNAFICGALSNPHDRYQSRIVPLAVLVLGVAGLSRFPPRVPAPTISRV